MKIKMKLSTKKKILIGLLFVLILITALIYPYNKRFIMTPSAHNDVSFLSADQKIIGGNKIKCVLYDNECSYYEVCFIVTENKESSAFNGLNELEIYADDIKIEDCSFLIHHYLGQRYVILLIGELPRAEELRLQWHDVVSVIE